MEDSGCSSQGLQEFQRGVCGSGAGAKSVHKCRSSTDRVGDGSGTAAPGKRIKKAIGRSPPE